MMQRRVRTVTLGITAIDNRKDNLRQLLEEDRNGRTVDF